MVISMLASLHGRKRSERVSHRSVRIHEKGFRGLYANNSSPLVYLAHHEEDSKQIKRVQGHADIEQQMSHVVWNSHSRDSFDRNWNDFLLNFGLGDNKWLSGNVFLKSASEV